MITPQLIISSLASFLIFMGTLGIYADNKEPIIYYPPSTNTTRLRVVEAAGQPTNSAATNLQGTTSLQGQSPSLQTPVGDQLQPNAGADNLPDNY